MGFWHLIAKIYGLQNQSLWQRLNTFIRKWGKERRKRRKVLVEEEEGWDRAMRRGRASPTLWKEGRGEEDRDRKGKEEERLRQRGRLCEEEAVGLGREGWKMRACRRGGKNKEWKGGGRRQEKGGCEVVPGPEQRGPLEAENPENQPSEDTVHWSIYQTLYTNLIPWEESRGAGGADRPEDNRTKRDEVWEFKLSWIEACWFT